jgi:hypothetical protein
MKSWHCLSSRIFFSAVDQDRGGFEYVWLMNNRQVMTEVSDSGSLLTLTRNGARGSANIQVRLSNSINLFHEVIRSIIVDFSK